VSTGVALERRSRVARTGVAKVQSLSHQRGRAVQLCNVGIAQGTRFPPKHMIIAPLLTALLLYPASTPAAAADVSRILTSYEQGDHAAALSELAAVSDFTALRKQFEDSGRRWVNADPSNRERRRLVAAVVALEAAHLAVNDRTAFKRLLEWGCTLIRRGSADAPERTWHLAAVALIQRSYDGRFLLDHLRHAESRFPGEPRFLLARAVNAEYRIWPAPKNPVATTEARASASGGLVLPVGMIPTLRHASDMAAWRLIPRLEELKGEPGIGPEVRMRLGHLYYRIGLFERAERELELAAELSTDPHVLFLARYFRGLLRESLGDHTGAIAAHSRALEFAPGAQSASIALASLLFSSDRRDEATRRLSRGLLVPGARDPWLLYQAGDYRSWPALIDELRARSQ
jgi:tetratricopeptide (TPR) repeat protein